MPIEKRDLHSGAKLFIPTESERAVRVAQKQLNKELEEVAQLKVELQKMIKQVKSENN